MAHIPVIAALALAGAVHTHVDLEADTVSLGEVTVTSIKQQSRIDAIPSAATLVTESELERLNAVAIKSISDVVPNFYIPDYGSRITSSIYVRGLGARMDQPAVGLNVDNVPFLNKDAYDFDIPDIVSVEMLRGPQSTLYGRNTMGGQINVTTLSPLDWQGVRLRAEGASGATLNFSGSVYSLLRPDMGISGSAQYYHQRGFFTNECGGARLDKENSGSVRLRFDWRPHNTFRLQNVFSSSLLRQGGYPYESVESGSIAYNDTCFYRRFLLNDGLTFRYRGSRLSLSGITSFQYLDDNLTLDQDFLPEDYFTLTQKKRELALTQDLILRPSSPSDIYSWLAGVFAFYRHTDMDAPVTFKNTGIERLIEDHRNAANPQYPIAWDSRSFRLNSSFKMPNYGVAAYHESKVNTGRWHIVAGLRLEYEHSAMRYHSYCNTGYTVFNNYDGSGRPLTHVPVDIDDTGRLSKHFLTLMPKVGILFDLPDISAGSNVYVNISRGYKSGGFNTQMFSDVLQQRLMGVMGIGASYDIGKIVSYRPETSWNYEAGAHLRIPSLRLGAEIAVFLIDCRDQQLTMFPDGLTTGRIMTNAGKTRSAGMEVSLNWKPLRQFTLAGSYGYTNARFRRFNDGREDYTGKHIPYAPCNTLFLQALYTLDLGGGPFCRSLGFDLNMRGTGRIYWNEANSLSQPFYALLGSSVSLEGDDASLQLWARNITGTRYHTFYFVSIGNEFVQRGRPFQIGLTLRYNIPFQK